MLASPFPRSTQRPMRRRGFQKRVPTMFSSVVRDRFGELKHDGLPRSNLRTNDGIDWQAGAMGDQTGTNGTATGSSSTTLTNTGAAWTTDQWKGHILVVQDSIINWAVILSNTATVLTIDVWAQATPTATSKYQVLAGGIAHRFIALSTDGTSPAVGDTTLAGEISTGGLAHAAPTSFTHTTATSSYSVSKTYSPSATFTVNKVALFIAANGGRMPFESLEPNAPTVINGDTLSQTSTITYT